MDKPAILAGIRHRDLRLATYSVSFHFCVKSTDTIPTSFPIYSFSLLGILEPLRSHSSIPAYAQGN
jgi:hypothetical protein